MDIKQFFVDAYECSGPLNNAELIGRALLESAAHVGATSMRCCDVQFQPHGITSVIILAESHMTVSTWPEFNFATFDAFLCNPQMDSAIAWEVVEATLRPKTINKHWIVRRIASNNS